MRCKSCLLDLEESAFYASNKTKCKECVKVSVRLNRLANIEHYRSFDRQRASRPDRVAARAAYRETDAYRISHAAACKRWTVSNAIRRHAHAVLAYALRSGKIQAQPCFVCGSKAEAHHPDYSAPLAVSWLCSKHPAKTHKEFSEWMREAA